ncbi:interferon-inducible GTPase 5-like [Pristis pectinata]|uniref:interferon-inducible GTPase 5-like n=1 Tax=Pristis pectinata TaxID=685728 RepID=UPI00223C9818|nr:interferon-inducible GTPase 5-like [Pristis pectinata]
MFSERQRTGLGGAKSRAKMHQSSEVLFFNPQELKRLESSYSSGGLEATVPLIQEKLNNLKSAKLHIAVTGESGTGKSSFINAMRKLDDTDERAAKVGNTETTMKPTPYEHPDFPEVSFWDLPGIGTTTFPAEDYLTEVNFQKYDCYILVLGDRFNENDANLAKEVNRLGKTLYFVRSKIDLVFQNKVVEKEKELDKIRNYYVDKLRNAGISEATVFLISIFQKTEFDFDDLIETLANSFDDIKKDLFLKSLPSMTIKILEQKRNQLKKQIWMLATLSGTIGAVPIPGLSFACDLGILVTAIIDFRSYLGLNDDSLQRLANMTGKRVEVLKAAVTTPLMGEINEDFVKRILLGSTYLAISAIEIGLDIIPVVGSIFGAASSFAMTYKLLRNALEDLTENAKRVVKVALVSD